MSLRAGSMMAACAAVIVVASLAVHAQERQPTLEELEMERLLEQAAEMFEKRGLSIEELSADFQYRCLRAIGAPDFCGCLVRHRPYPLRFQQYIGITSRTRSELDYDTLGASARVIVDRVFALRDRCVGG